MTKDYNCKHCGDPIYFYFEGGFHTPQNEDHSYHRCPEREAYRDYMKKHYW